MSVIPYQPLYTAAEAAEVLKVGRSDVYRLIREGKLIALQLGSFKIRGSDLERFIESFKPCCNSEAAKEKGTDET